MKPNFALDLSHEGINLLHRSQGGWSLVGSVALDDPYMGSHLEELRRSAAMLESGGITTKLIIPSSQILYTTLAAPGPDDISREVQIRAALDGLTPYPVGELVFDWRAEGDEARVAVCARETMNEAESFAADFKFNPVSFVTRPGRGEFSGEPFFGKTKAANRILGPGERVEPDASPVPRNPRAIELPAEARIDLAPDELPTSEPAPEAQIDAPLAAASTDEPAQPIAPDRTEPAAPLLDDPFAALDALASEYSDAEEAEADSPTDPAAKPRKGGKKRKRNRGTEDQGVAAPALAPFPPPPDEIDSAPLASPKPILRGPKDPKVSTSPDTAPDTAPEPARTESPAPKPAAKGPKSDAVPPAPMPFHSSRGSAGADTEAAGTGAASDRLKSIAPRIGIPASGRDAGESVPPAGTSRLAPDAAHPAAPPPVDRIRADMAEALSKPLPSPDNTPEPAPKTPTALAGIGNAARGLVDRAGAGLRSSTEAARSSVEARRKRRGAPPEDDAPSAVAPPAPSDGTAAQDNRRGWPLSRKTGPRNDVEARRNSEADALTVFGARKSQEIGGRPKYLGLILTLILLLVMAIIAVWSSFFVNDGEVSLFNPGPDVDVASTETPVVAPAVPTPDPVAVPTPSASETSEVLSPEAAEARYAATGIWQRAPELLPDPETARLDDLRLAALAPVEPGREAAELPAPTLGAVSPALLADPLPPPPPGTSFDLNESGLVRATAEGALSPTGILVFAGRPEVVPPTRPEIAPEIVVAPTVPDIPRIRPRTRPEGLIPIAPVVPDAAPAETTLPGTETPAAAPEPDDNAALATALPNATLAAVHPAPRPADLIVSTSAAADTGVIDAAVADVVEAAFESATELAVSRSIAPTHRPANFAKIVDSAQIGASDGSMVVAAAATVTPTIPTSASVATRATMENALNLREINLIGIYGTSNARRALVRLKNGRYLKVKVGDKLEGGKVTSITASQLTYQKGSRAYTLEVLPLG